MITEEAGVESAVRGAKECVGRGVGLITATGMPLERQDHNTQPGRRKGRKFQGILPGMAINIGLKWLGFIKLQSDCTMSWDGYEGL